MKIFQSRVFYAFARRWFLCELCGFRSVVFVLIFLIQRTQSFSPRTLRLIQTNAESFPLLFFYSKNAIVDVRFFNSFVALLFPLVPW